jgi:anti-sigma-K factor RskA
MQSLSVDQTADIRAHLAACALCRSDLAGITGDLALVGLSVPQQALPEGARKRFLDRLAAEPVARSRSAQALVTEPAAPIAQTVVTEPAPISRRRGASFWAPWLAALAMAGVAIALAVQNYALNDALNYESGLVTGLAAKASRAQQVLEVFTSPDAQHVVLTPGNAPDEPNGRATYLPDRGGLIFQANNLKPLPQGKTYELWVIPANGKAPLPAGLFEPDTRGSASLVMPPLPTGIPAKGFGVTMENTGGSSSPTAPILLSGTVSGA